jgi:hypothetical protein
MNLRHIATVLEYKAILGSLITMDQTVLYKLHPGAKRQGRKKGTSAQLNGFCAMRVVVTTFFKIKAGVCDSWIPVYPS